MRRTVNFFRALAVMFVHYDRIKIGIFWIYSLLCSAFEHRVMLHENSCVFRPEVAPLR
jgi:hypothetical protein